VINIYEIKSAECNDFFRKLKARGNMDVGDAADTVRKIVNEVKENGDSAVFKFTKQFDNVEIDANTIKVSQSEIDKAYEKIDNRLLKIIRRAKANIEKFHSKQLEKSWFNTEDNGVVLGQIYSPIEKAGIYVPGGTAPLPSSVLMCAIPAKVAGVKSIIMVTPPQKDGSVNEAILVAAKEAGVDEIYKVGGAQAIAALAFGTESVPKVDKIVGPGNIYVALAKKMVYGYCDIDMIAGPSEILVLADDSANPEFVAADLLSQAEHDKLASSILVTTSRSLADAVKNEIIRQVSGLSRKDIIAKSLENYGAIIVTGSIDEAVETANALAPEHLELCVEEPFGMLGRIKNAGAIFLGNYSSEPLGDYFAGPNHVLPTGGTARFFSPLSVSEFTKKSSVIYYTKSALLNVKEDAASFADAEGLSAHANAIRIRFDKN